MNVLFGQSVHKMNSTKRAEIGSGKFESGYRCIHYYCCYFVIARSRNMGETSEMVGPIVYKVYHRCSISILFKFNWEPLWHTCSYQSNHNSYIWFVRNPRSNRINHYSNVDFTLKIPLRRNF